MSDDTKKILQKCVCSNYINIGCAHQQFSEKGMMTLFGLAIFFCISKLMYKKALVQTLSYYGEQTFDTSFWSNFDIVSKMVDTWNFCHDVYFKQFISQLDDKKQKEIKKYHSIVSTFVIPMNKAFSKLSHTNCLIEKEKEKQAVHLWTHLAKSIIYHFKPSKL